MKTSTGAFIFKSRKRINLNIYLKSVLSDFNRLLFIGIKTNDIWSETDKMNWKIADTIGLAGYKGLWKKLWQKLETPVGVHIVLAFILSPDIKTPPPKHQC